MRLLFILMMSTFSLHFISCSNKNRIENRMYISFDNVRYCVRRLNSTHQIGCQSSIRGNSGRMYMIDNEEEFTQYLNDDKKLIDSYGSFIVVLDVNLFDEDHVDRLIKRLDKKLNGLLLYLKSNLTRPNAFSHDDQCPNHRSNFYLNQTNIVNWNKKGTSLFFRSFPFPIMLIDEEDSYKRLNEFYQKFNTSQSKMTCALELKTFQYAAHTTTTCMRRNDISYLLIDNSEAFCDPINGLNIYSKLPQTIEIASTKQRQLKSVILILVSTDSFQMFLKSKGPTGGSQQPATGLILFLTIAHLIGQEQNLFNQQDKEIIFVTLDGDSLDYSASFKFTYDMKNGKFSTGYKNEQSIQFEHIHSIIEFQSLSMTEKIWLHSYPSSLINQTFVDMLTNNNPMINKISEDIPLPPASSQIFLQQSSSSIPAYVLSSINENQLFNPYYHSFFDDPSTLSINTSTLEYNTTTKLSLWIKSIAEPFVQTLIESLVGLKKPVYIKQEIINNLIYCIFKNINCPLIQNVTNQSIGNTFKRFEQTSMPFSINTYPLSTTPTFPFIQHVLSYFLRDRSYDFENLNETLCEQRANNDSFSSFVFVGGYLSSMENVNNASGFCVRSYVRTIQSISPAFLIENYDLSQTTYPAWTESRWTAAITLRLFVIPTKSHEIMTFIIGVSLLFSSFIFLFMLRRHKIIDLLQPSSS